MTKTTNFQRKT